MRDLTRALGDLREDLAKTQAEITIMERTIRQLETVIDLVESVQKGPLRRRELNSISERLAVARARQSLLARLMEECGHERDWRGVYAKRTADANGSLDAFIRSGNSEAG
jgi:hypothetical protein